MFRFGRSLFPLGALCLALTLVPSASASTVEPLSLAQLSQRAQMIFTGRVIDKRTGWNPERTRVYTYVTLEVDRYLKGGVGAESVTIRTMGGQVGPYRVMVSGAPSFGDGEEVLLFCAGGGARMLTVMSLSLGKFTLETDADGRQMVKRDIRGLIFANHRSDSHELDQPIQKFSLADVEQRVQAALNP